MLIRIVSAHRLERKAAVGCFLGVLVSYVAQGFES